MDKNSMNKPSDDDLNKMNVYGRVKAMSEYVLSQNSITNSTEALSGRNIRDLCKKTFPKVDVGINVFNQYLSKLKRDTGSAITGDGHKQGYYFSDLSKLVAEVEKQEDILTDKPTEEGRKFTQREKLLYSHLVEWLRAEGCHADDTSAIKAMGPWGNPDVTGLLHISLPHCIQVEITTIEAKFSQSQWEKWIFEAVSHRRFANRSYFAYAQPLGIADKVPKDILYYCELYRVGLLTINFDDDIYRELTSGKKTSIRGQEVDINVVHPAPFADVRPKAQSNFFRESLKINNQQELFKWGKPPLDE